MTGHVWSQPGVRRTILHRAQRTPRTLLYRRAVLPDAPQIFALIDCKLESSRVPPMPSPTVL